ncbi:Cytochrome c2 [compost metagenome]|uniref:c-type cytochrome n=1 Tax=Sphingomonas sp. PL20 TaxID=2760712 RepID=UPI001AE6CBFC
MRWSVFGLAGVSTLFLIAAAGSDPVDTRLHGAALFENRCARCHGLNGDGDGGLGPSLVGVLGKPAASRSDFLYSAALKAKGGVWTPEVLDRYLADPQAFAPGADMDVPSPDPAERAAIIEHLKTLK